MAKEREKVTLFLKYPKVENKGLPERHRWRKIQLKPQTSPLLIRDEKKGKWFPGD